MQSQKSINEILIARFEVKNSKPVANPVVVKPHPKNWTAFDNMAWPVVDASKVRIVRTITSRPESRYTRELSYD